MPAKRLLASDSEKSTVRACRRNSASSSDGSVAPIARRSSSNPRPRSPPRKTDSQSRSIVAPTHGGAAPRRPPGCFGRGGDDGRHVVRGWRDAVVEVRGDPKPAQVDVLGAAQRRGHGVRISKVRPVHDRQTQEEILNRARQRAVAVERAEDAQRVAEYAARPWYSPMGVLQPGDAGVMARLPGAVTPLGTAAGRRAA